MEYFNWRNQLDMPAGMPYHSLKLDNSLTTWKKTLQRSIYWEIKSLTKFNNPLCCSRLGTLIFTYFETKKKINNIKWTYKIISRSIWSNRLSKIYIKFFFLILSSLKWTVYSSSFSRFSFTNFWKKFDLAKKTFTDFDFCSFSAWYSWYSYCHLPHVILLQSLLTIFFFFSVQ